MKPIILAIDGIIGAGKTSLVKLLGVKLTNAIKMRLCSTGTIKTDNVLFEHATNDNLNICIIYEPVELWKSTGALAHFYEDKANHAYDFQSFVYITRIQAIKNAVKANPDADIYILERSVFSDEYLFVEMLHNDGTLNDTQMRMYKTWCRTYDELLPWSPSGFIYLSPSLKETIARIKTRARVGEDVNHDYQMALLLQHEKIFGNSNGLAVIADVEYPVHAIRTDEDFRLENGGHVEIVNGVADFVIELASPHDHV